MGILNLTPDSFSDGGRLGSVDAAVEQAERMVEAGADILDVGGESTRPGAVDVSEQEEIRRVLPVLEALRERLTVPLSVDTRKAAVARRALEAGASIVNDVSGLSYDEAMPSTVAEMEAGVVLMHMRGTPADMSERTQYGDLPGEVAAELGVSVTRAREAGVHRDAIVLDPGIGFAKTPAQSFRLVRDLGRLHALGFPVLVGASRKSFLGDLLGVPPGERVTAGAVIAALAYQRGARIFRTHDVAPTLQALLAVRAVEEGLESVPGGTPPGRNSGSGGKTRGRRPGAREETGSTR